jgi:hypothetical protein
MNLPQSSMLTPSDQWPIPLTPENYQKQIPAWCKYRTVQEHMDGLLLCWGITLHMEKGEPMTLDYCRGCELCREPK